MSAENYQEEFEKYAAANREKPIDPEIEKEAREVLRRDALLAGMDRDDQPDRKTPAPQGELDKVDVPAAEIPEAIEKLTAAKNTLTDGLKKLSDAKMFGDPSVTFATITEAMDDEEIAMTFPEETRNAVAAIREYMKIDPEMTLFNLPGIIKEFLSKLKRNKNRPDDESETGGSEV